MGVEYGDGWRIVLRRASLRISPGASLLTPSVPNLAAGLGLVKDALAFEPALALAFVGGDAAGRPI